MNKRKFIKFVAAGMASPFLSSLLRAESEKELKNWAGNLEYGTNRLYPARSLEEVQRHQEAAKNETTGNASLL